MGDTAIFIPPILCDARVFANQIVELLRDHVIMFTPIVDVNSIEEIAVRVLSCAPREFVFVGASMGGVVALEMLRHARIDQYQCTG